VEKQSRKRVLSLNDDNSFCVLRTEYRAVIRLGDTRKIKSAPSSPASSASPGRFYITLRDAHPRLTLVLTLPLSHKRRGIVYLWHPFGPLWWGLPSCECKISPVSVLPAESGRPPRTLTLQRSLLGCLAIGKDKPLQVIEAKNRSKESKRVAAALEAILTHLAPKIRSYREIHGTGYGFQWCRFLLLGYDLFTSTRLAKLVLAE
jgi:hypothetical protein